MEFGRKLRDWLYDYSTTLPLRIIYDEKTDTPYLERYFLFSALGLTGYLHRIVRSDPDSGLHNNPWSYAISVILSGYYYEERGDGTYLRRFVNFIRSSTFHRIIVPGSQPSVWTIFIHRDNNTQDWGFMEKVKENAVAFRKQATHHKTWWEDAPLAFHEKRRKPKD